MQAFLDLDRPYLRALPASPYVIADWKRARVNIDYHVEFDHHYYSVAYALVRKEVDLRITRATIEVFVGSKRVAVMHSANGNRLFDSIRTHASRTSGPCRVDSRQAAELGQANRPLHGNTRGAAPSREATPRAGLQGWTWFDAIGTRERYDPHGGRMSARNRSWITPVQLRRLGFSKQGLDGQPLPAKQAELALPATPMCVVPCTTNKRRSPAMLNEHTLNALKSLRLTGMALA